MLSVFPQEDGMPEDFDGYNADEFLFDPVEPVRPSRMKGLKALAEAYSKMSFQARNLGLASSLLARMYRDKETLVVMTLAGAMVPGGLRGAVCDAIEHGLVDIIVSTGANVSHDIVEGMGFKHYRHCRLKTDTELKDAFIDRVYDTLVAEKNFNQTAEIVMEGLADLEGNTSDAVTRYLGSIATSDCILKSAYEHDVPIFVPALNDSELGIVLNRFNSKQDPERRIVWDGLQDNLRFAELIKDAGSYGIIICGGGVPKNWAQQVTPLLEYLHYVPGEMVHRFSGYKYGITITTDTPVYGGLSGCTFSESISWGKYMTESEYVTVNCDTTIALPIIIGAAIEEIGPVLQAGSS
jgi:deoxyhypusine synthase